MDRVIQLVQLKMLPPSDKKKREATFIVLERGKPIREVRVKFGQQGASDYLDHKDVVRRERYRIRHAHTPRDDPMSPAALSWWVTWGPYTNLKNNINEYRKHYNVL